MAGQDLLGGGFGSGHGPIAIASPDETRGEGKGAGGGGAAGAYPAGALGIPASRSLSLDHCVRHPVHPVSRYPFVGRRSWLWCSDCKAVAGSAHSKVSMTQWRNVERGS